MALSLGVAQEKVLNHITFKGNVKIIHLVDGVNSGMVYFFIGDAQGIQLI